MDQLKNSQFTSCDIADALVQLGHTNVFIPNIKPIAWPKDLDRFIGPAYTVEFVSSACTHTPILPASTPHHIDTAPRGSILVMKSPSEAINAVFGGLMATRAKVVGVEGVVIEGRVRDIQELQDKGLPVMAMDTSVLGAKPYVRVAKINEPILMAQHTPWPVNVRPGDVMIADRDGIVCLPVECIDQVLQLCTRNTAIDAKCMQDIEQGSTIKETFAKHRGK